MARRTTKRCLPPAAGPKRKPNSVLKISCAYKDCQNIRIDCKNKPWTLDVGQLQRKRVRRLHPHAQKARFCSAKHQKLCLASDTPPRGGREALNAAQAVWLFKILAEHKPWSAVMFLLAIVLGERVDLVRQVRDSWLTGLSHDGESPTICIPAGVNNKTRGRQNVPLQKEFAHLLCTWMTTTPLAGPQGQWPHVGQKLSVKRAGGQPGKLLFPGRRLGGVNKRSYGKAVTARAWFDCFRHAQNVLLEQRRLAHSRGEEHCFDDVTLRRVTSHSCKKTAVYPVI